MSAIVPIRSLVTVVAGKAARMSGLAIVPRLIFRGLPFRLGRLLVLAMLGTTQSTGGEPGQAEAGKERPNAPWDAAFMTAPPQELLQAVSGRPTPKDADFEVLLHESQYRFDAQGRRTLTERSVYRCVTRQAVEQYTQISAVWRPWHQEKPRLRVRVVRPDGTAQEIDPASIAESPIGATAPDVLTDLRMLKIPLPRLSVGSIVEREIITSDLQPLFPQGVVEEYSLSASTPIGTFRLTIDVPEALAFRYRKVPPPSQWLATTFFELAQKRLARLTDQGLPRTEAREKEARR